MADRLERVGIGIEKDPHRAAFAASRVHPPSQVVQGDARDIAKLGLEPFDLIFTSPPYTTFRDWDDGVISPEYFADLRKIFASLRDPLKDTGAMIVEVSNVREGTTSRTLAWDAARKLGALFAFRGATVRCNTGPEPAGPGFEHSYLLVFTHG